MVNTGGLDSEYCGGVCFGRRWINVVVALVFIRSQ